MLRTFITITLASCLVAACSSDPDDKGSGGGTGGTTPTGATATGSGSGSGSSLGPSCKAYIDCCKEITAKYPQMGASCDSIKAQIDDAQKKGVSTSTYETACKSGVDTFKGSGYCKG